LLSHPLCHRPPPSPLFPYTTLFRSPQIRPREYDRALVPPPRETALSVLAQCAVEASFCLRRLVPRRKSAKLRPAPEWLAEAPRRSEEHTSELQSRENLVCRLLLEKK